MKHLLNRSGKQSGLSMIEVLVTMVILMVGMLGLAGLQTQSLRSEMESYQRVQALILLQDMVGRINANRANALSYVTTTLGTPHLGTDNPAGNCAGLVGRLLDSCEWNNVLLGASEVQAGGRVGMMIGGRGCVTLIDATDQIYQISVAWQGLGKTFSQVTNLCGQNLYGNDDAQRRVVSHTIRIANLS